MKTGLALLLLFLTSTASAQVDDRLFADYVRRLVECCPSRSVVVFYTRTNGEPDKFLERLALGAAATKVPLDHSSRRYRTVIENNVSAHIVAVAYDLEPDAVRVLGEVADAKQALSISSTEEDIYTTMFSFDSVTPDRFRSGRTRGDCKPDNCPIQFHSDVIGWSRKERRADEIFVRARKGLDAYKRDHDRTTLIHAARLLQDALRYVADEQLLRIGEWHDPYTPHYGLGEVFFYLENCEAAELEWAISSKNLESIAPLVARELQKGQRQCRLSVFAPVVGGDSPVLVDDESELDHPSGKAVLGVIGVR
jgi:hypothetical protein